MRFRSVSLRLGSLSRRTYVALPPQFERRVRSRSRARAAPLLFVFALLLWNRPRVLVREQVSFSCDVDSAAVAASETVNRLCDEVWTSNFQFLS